MARILARAFPTFAFTIVFLIRKRKGYGDEFAAYPTRARLETNFWTGDVLTESQYWKSPKADAHTSPRAAMRQKFLSRSSDHSGAPIPTGGIRDGGRHRRSDASVHRFRE